ncbi:hypothetical protein ACM66B_005266 [Microbotryomycetes sp. NB124-2]
MNNSYDDYGHSHVYGQSDLAWNTSMSSLDAASMPAHFSARDHQQGLQHGKPQHDLGSGTSPATQWAQHYQPEPKHMTWNNHQQQQHAQLGVAAPSSTHWNAPGDHQQHTHQHSPVRINAMLPPSSYSPRSFPASISAQRSKLSSDPNAAARRSSASGNSAQSPSKSPVPSLTSTASTDSTNSSCSNSETRTPPSVSPPQQSRDTSLSGPDRRTSSSHVNSKDDRDHHSTSSGSKNLSSGSMSFKSNADREAYLARNRLAASRSRQRKKQRVGELEARAQEYSVLNQMLQQQAIALHAEFVQLRSMLTHVIETTPPSQPLSVELESYLAKERAGQAGVGYIQSIAGDTLSTDYTL